MSFRVTSFLAENPSVAERFERVRAIASEVRSSEYHLTNDCNIRCKGCWFFEYDFDQRTREQHDLVAIEAFVEREAKRGITAALLIGGEPALYPERIAIFAQHMPYVTISTNGLRRLPREGFENVAIAISLFGGGKLDDDLRAHAPNGKSFVGLFDKALRHYKNDARAGFVYALSEQGIEYIDDTVRRIRDNGNTVVFNYYSEYSRKDIRARRESWKPLLEAALEVASRYPDTVLSHPYFIEAMIKGATPWGEFGYASCPSISADNPAHDVRRKNGLPTLPLFNTYAADFRTVEFCCTSGQCDSCRDSQAVMSWLLSNARRFWKSETDFVTWLEIAESYWRGFVWSPLAKSSTPSLRVSA